MSLRISALFEPISKELREAHSKTTLGIDNVGLLHCFQKLSELAPCAFREAGGHFPKITAFQGYKGLTLFLYQDLCITLLPFRNEARCCLGRRGPVAPLGAVFLLLIELRGIFLLYSGLWKPRYAEVFQTSLAHHRNGKGGIPFAHLDLLQDQRRPLFDVDLL